MFGKKGVFFDYAIHQVRTISQHLSVRIALALSLISMGTATSVYIVDHQSVERSNTNACAINQFADTLKQRIEQGKQPGYQEAVRDLDNLQKRLQPPLDECK